MRAIRNEYDEDGRLVAQIDVDGNRLEFDRDIQGRVETIRDRRGNATVVQRFLRTFSEAAVPV